MFAQNFSFIRKICYRISGFFFYRLTSDDLIRNYSIGRRQDIFSAHSVRSYFRNKKKLINGAFVSGIKYYVHKFFRRIRMEKRVPPQGRTKHEFLGSDGSFPLINFEPCWNLNFPSFHQFYRLEICIKKVKIIRQTKYRFNYEFLVFIANSGWDGT